MRRKRPHVWPCRHCEMVEWYRLERHHQEVQAEGVFLRDETFRPITFKEWLRGFQWETFAA